MRQIHEVVKKSKLYEGVASLADVLSTGSVFVVDPSIGSSSSSPAWALYRKGVLIDSSIISTGGSHTPLWARARMLGQTIAYLTNLHWPDVLVYEDIPATSGFNQNAIASLLKAVGIILACSKSEHVLGIHPASWKPYVRPEYKKGDREDAVEIGYIVTSLAAYITESTRHPVSSRASRA